MMVRGQAVRLSAFASLANSLTLSACRLGAIRFSCARYSQPVESALPMWTACAGIGNGIADSGHESRG